MSFVTSNVCCLRIINFEPATSVTYAIVKIVGSVETNDQNPECTSAPNCVTITSSSRHDVKADLVNGRFKVFLELNRGENSICITHCDQNVQLKVTYEPNLTDYTVIPLYVICDGHDGRFQAPENEKNDVDSALRRITLCAKLLQCFTAEKLHDNGLGRKTFSLKGGCSVFRSKLDYTEARKMGQEELWGRIGREIMQSEIGFHAAKYLAFLSCTTYVGEKFTSFLKSHEDLIGITDGYVALGGGGLALFGTACLYTWPEYFDEVAARFEDNALVDRTAFLDDSCYRGTIGGCFSTTLGSVLHELYHTFDLGHTEVGVMARGFDNIYKFFTTDEKTASSDVSKGFQHQIQFKEEFEASKLSERLEKANKKKEFRVIRKFDAGDDTFLTKSCAVILSYHKWFQSSIPEQPYTLFYDPSNRFIKSTAGIRVVELRRQYDEMVRFSWTFEGKVLKYSFQIPEQALDETLAILFVEDKYSNIFKKAVNFV
ncbi:uncharacterized protein LOC132704105 isoform X2 [Cylas formicarius]|uniref:uncharacterized protein LOC132704105 isoform X2 n=1 Tax=Cylas formicarius TaxID=197179 RepID=UPI002958ADFC|nr:uncharacterized protein LOC132704105 isoform X2 [Cylas formicarius]